MGTLASLGKGNLLLHSMTSWWAKAPIGQEKGDKAKCCPIERVYRTFSDIPKADGRRIWLAWMSNWDYANDIPTEPWRSAMTLPKEVSLQKRDNGEICLIQNLVKELREMVDETFVDHRLTCSKGISHKIIVQPENPFMLEVELIVPEKSIGGLRFFETTECKGAAVYIDREKGLLVVDRTDMINNGFHECFSARTVAPIEVENDMIMLEIIVDKGSIEVIAQGGKITLTNLIMAQMTTQLFLLFLKMRI